jgi:alpha-L-rhamnosidase
MAGPFGGSLFVWIDSNPPHRSEFALFERKAVVSQLPASCLIHLFADTRFRLRVNGQVVGCGPGRFVTQFPEYDTYDIAPWLKVGENRIVVEVCHYGSSSFQTMPDGKPGFIAAGGADGLSFATPGEWEGSKGLGWRQDSPSFSFAQGPVEILDCRVDPQPCALRVLTPEESPWGSLTPYSGAPLPLNIVLPQRVEVQGRLSDEEQRWGFMTPNPTGQRPWTAYCSWIWSPKAQTIPLSCFWTEVAVNGRPLPTSWKSDLGSHGQAHMPLEEGWNLLTGEMEVLTENWPCLLGIPRSAGVSLHSRRDRETLAQVSRSPVGQRSGLFLPKAEDERPPDGWVELSGDLDSLTPARLCAWDRAAEEGKGKVWCYSFEGAFHGHICLDVEGPPGTLVDVAVDDWQREDGLPALYRSNPFTDAADRFILKGGRQLLELFQARGGKVIQVSLRPPEDGPLDLHGIWVKSRLVMTDPLPEFSCDDPVLTWAWKPSLLTLACSTDDTYADCPWRERSAYIGDSLVNIHLHFLITRDLRPAFRTLRIFGQAQREDGHLPGCAPSWLREPHEDYTLQWILAVRDMWAETGDLDFVEESWPVIERIWASPAWQKHESGLWNSQGLRMFIDWGVLPSERSGDAHAGLNILRVASLRACGEMAAALGKNEDSERWHGEAARVEETLFGLLWREDEGRLAASLGAETPNLHGMVWALAYKVGDEGFRSKILSALEPLLLENLQRGLTQGQFKGHLELFFLFFLLPALAEMGRADLAEKLIRDHYGYLQSLGDDTLPECFCRVEQGEGSRCHSWSGAAAVYAARWVLGLRVQTPGDPRCVLLEPRTHEIESAQGSLPVEGGMIEVAWHKANGLIVAKVQCPPGITVIPGPQVELVSD